MSITTCQKVTLISCSVLCISLFLPRMLLPRGKKEMGQPEVGPGFYPPVMHRLSVPDDPEKWGVDHSYSIAHSVEAMAKVKGIGRGKKHNLMGQVIPIYGFGILLYIFYIIYKLTCRGKTNKSGNYTTATKTNMGNMTMTNEELARLQERLLQTERMMDRIVSAKRRSSGSGRRRKSKTTTSKKEERLLKQLRQITLMIQEGRLEGASPEMEAEQVPYGADWEGYPEETYPEYDDPSDSCDRRRFQMIRLEKPSIQPTAEALAERMEQEEEEMMARKLSIVREEDEDNEEEGEDDADEDEEEIEEDIDVEGEEEEEEKEEEEEEEEEEVEEEDEEEEEEEEVEEAEAEKRLLLSLPSLQPERKQQRVGLEVSKELQCLSGGKKQITFSDHKDVFHYPKEDEEEDEGEGEEEDEGTEVDEADEEDPVMEAESLLFGCEGCPNPEEEAEEDEEEYLLMLAAGEGGIHADMPKEVAVSGLRMRNRRET